MKTKTLNENNRQYFMGFLCRIGLHLYDAPYPSDNKEDGLLGIPRRNCCRCGKSQFYHNGWIDMPLHTPNDAPAQPNKVPLLTDYKKGLITGFIAGELFMLAVLLAALAGHKPL
jgi:hypothetical protein